MSSIEIVFALLLVYQLKHFLADYILQGEYMLKKFLPGWGFVKPLLAHVGVHAAMTFGIAGCAMNLLDHLLPRDYVNVYAFLIALFDGTVHFCMDRLKAGPRYMGRWKPITGPEYVAIKAILANAAAGGAGSEDYRGQAQQRQKLRGNKLFWWCLGFDQMVHHVTHYACIYFILKLAGIVP